MRDCISVLTEEIWDKVPQGTVTVTSDVALIAIVGRELGTSPAVAVKVLWQTAKLM